MSITAFCSPLHGAYTSANVSAIAMCMAEQYGTKTLIMNTHYNLNNLEKPLLGKIEVNLKDYYTGKGLDEATALYETNNLNERTVESVISDIGEWLALLPGTTKSFRETFDNEVERSVLKRTIRELARYYSNIVIDVNAGFGEYTMAVLEAADNIVVNLRQNRTMIEEFFANESIKPLLAKKKVYYLFGEYDEMCTLNIRNIRSIFKEVNRNNSGVIPYSTGYRDKISECSIYNYLINYCNGAVEGSKAYDYLADAIDDYANDNDRETNWWYQIDLFTKKLM